MHSYIQSITPDSWTSSYNEYLQLINNNLDQIPEIGLVPSHCLKDGQLVRFRGMIQDMADPVLYLRRYEVYNKITCSTEIRCGKYKDLIDIKEDEVLNDNSPNVEHSERRSLYCVSIPGLNDWVKPPSTLYAETNSTVEMFNDSTNKVKRNLDTMEEEVDTDLDSSTKIVKRLAKNETSNVEHVSILLNHPIDGNNNYSCLINIYEDTDEELVKMNSVVDVIGFVSFTSDCDEYSHLPATLVPRLHAVSFKRITHSNPFHCKILDRGELLMKAEKIRNDLICILRDVFLGDVLTAEYVLCNLISRVYHRNELLTLGHFSVNITNLPMSDSYSEKVSSILKNIVTKSHYLPLTLEKMNSQKFLPEKDYEFNCLKSGLLQLSDHTHLFIDETKMESGQLNSNGVSNLKALEEITTNQSSSYDFKYVKIEFPVDLPIIVLSEGKSLLPTNVQVILTPESGRIPTESLKSGEEMLKEPLLSEIRNFLIAASHAEFNLSDDLIETIQRDYVKLRQEERKVNESDLHLLLILSRLISLSFGHVTLTKEMWDKAFDMELYRKERINNREP